MKKSSLFMFWLSLFLLAAASSAFGQKARAVSKSGSHPERLALAGFVPASPLDHSQITGIDYPIACRKLGIEGTVKVQMLIDPSGHVLRVKVFDSPHPDLSKACVARLMGMKFNPARNREGDPIPTWNTMAIRFELD